MRQWKSTTTREELSFPVETRPIYTVINGVETELPRRVTFNPRDNQELNGYVSKKYHLIPHTDVFKAVDEVLKDNNLVLKDQRYLANKNKARMNAFFTLEGKDRQVINERYGIDDAWNIGFSIGNTLDGVGSLRVSNYLEHLI